MDVSARQSCSQGWRYFKCTKISPRLSPWQGGRSPLGTPPPPRVATSRTLLGSRFLLRRRLLWRRRRRLPGRWRGCYVLGRRRRVLLARRRRRSTFTLPFGCTRVSQAHQGAGAPILSTRVMGDAHAHLADVGADIEPGPKMRVALHQAFGIGICTTATAAAFAFQSELGATEILEPVIECLHADPIEAVRSVVAPVIDGGLVLSLELSRFVQGVVEHQVLEVGRCLLILEDLQRLIHAEGVLR